LTADIYLDHGSATPIVAPARDAMVAALDRFGDPLSIHAPGRDARRLLEESRAEIAHAIGGQPDEIVFTSGGTESVALGIAGGVRAVRELGTRIVVSAIEHPSVGGVCAVLESDGFEVALVPADADGRVDVDAFAAEIRRPGTLLASLQHANHELGTIQQMAEVGRLAHEAGVRFHTDACQTAGRLPIAAGELHIDFLSLSAHKFGGPPGVGALFVRRGVSIAAYPCGDDRERKRRSGMENVPGIAAMAAAISTSVSTMADEAARQWSLTSRLRDGIVERVPGAHVYGHATHRMPHLVCFAVDDVDPGTLLMALDERGFRVGAGSLCSGRPEDPSPVLEQIGAVNPHGFRVGVGPSTNEDDVTSLLDTLPNVVADLQQVERASAEALGRFRSPGP